MKIFPKLTKVKNKVTIPSTSKLEDGNTFAQLKKMNLDFSRNQEDHSYISAILLSPPYKLLRTLVYVLREKRDEIGMRVLINYLEDMGETASVVKAMAKRRIKQTSLLPSFSKINQRRNILTLKISKL